MELIRLENIFKTYYLGEVDVPVLQGVSLSIHRGEMVALMGASGSGKTTLMNILGCLDHATSGEYWFDGQEVGRLSPNQRAVLRTEKLGFVFQNFNLLARTSALQNVVMPLDYGAHHFSPADASRLARTVLERVGLADRAGHEPSQMSGGQQQRVAIGRALVNRPILVLADEPTGNLDSHTSVDILRMFQQLNSEGITVVLVTHDPQVAAYAQRIIRIADGRIEDDRPNPANPVGNGGHPLAGRAVPPAPERHGVRSLQDPAATADVPPSPGIMPAPRATRSLLPATWRSALTALRRNKLRSGLSGLGVIIAVAAVIAMTEIGQGSKAAVQKGIASMGANTLMIFSGAANTGGVNLGAGSVMTLTPQDAGEIARQCPAVQSVAPLVRARAQLVRGNRNCVPEQIAGTTPAFLDVRDWKVAQGEVFSDRDVRNCAKVCMIGNTVKRDLFPDTSPLGREIRINNVSFRVIGLLKRKGANMMGMDQDNVVLAPWTTVKYRVSGSALTNTNQSSSAGSSSSAASDAVNTLSDLYPTTTSLYASRSSTETADTPQPVRFNYVDQIIARAASATKIKLAIRQMTELLRERHRLRGGQADDFNIHNMAEMSKMMSSTTQQLSTLLLAVALISLVVGGVGIMNIMLVSVTERTREIGLRMAVGARSYHILRQFLVEAVVLCLAGGALGILCGRGASILVRSLLGWPTQASWAMVVAAVVVSVGVGIVFGFYPAWKASRLDPIEALRYE